MKLYLRILIFVISFLILALFVIINYKIGKRKGLKKSLYKITYRSVCVIFAFLLTPYINEYILNYDLYQKGRAIQYNGLHFYRIIDFIEEVIVHNEVLSDIYNLFPSLKNLLMDFPQVLFMPFTFLLVFFIMSLLLLPLYLYLSYKRNRRVLYEKSANKKGNIWAGIINATQSVVLVCIILMPINGLARIYKDSSNELVDSESNICLQNEYLVKYELACEVVEGYNSTVFSLLGKDFMAKYLYDSLTRINFDNKDTSLNKEVISIAKAGIVLNKTGLLNAIQINDFEDVTSINFNELTDDDIDIIIESFEQSLYTKDVVFEVFEWSKEYLDWLIKDLVDIKFDKVEFTYQEVISELRLILKTINYILNNEEFLQSIKNVYKAIDDYITGRQPQIAKLPGITLFFNIVYGIDFESLLTVYHYLSSSNIYNKFVPMIIENLLKPYNINIKIHDMQQFNHMINYILEIARIVNNHRYIYSIIHLLNDLTTSEIQYLASFFEYLNATDNLAYFVKDLIDWAIEDANVELEIPTEFIYEIQEWDREFELVQLVIQIAYTYKTTGEIDYSKAWYGLTHYNDTNLFKMAFKLLIRELPKIFVIWLTEKGYEYLVGEYVKD